MINDKNHCHELTACRWVDYPVDPISAQYRSNLNTFMTHEVCPSIKSLLRIAPEAPSLDELESHCFSSFRCNQVNPTICNAFTNRLESNTFPSNAILQKSSWKHDVQDWMSQQSRLTRRLLESEEQDEWVEQMLLQMTTEELVQSMMTCNMCYDICDDRKLLKEWRNNPPNATQIDAFTEECNSVAHDPNEGKPCRPICDVIPRENCALYSDHCYCGHMQHAQAEEGASVFPDPYSTPDTPEEPTMTVWNGSCVEDEEFRHLCYPEGKHLRSKRLW